MVGGVMTPPYGCRGRRKKADGQWPSLRVREIESEEIATPVCAPARNDRNIESAVVGLEREGENGGSVIAVDRAGIL